MQKPPQTSGWTLAEWQKAQQDGQGFRRLQVLLTCLEKDKDVAWISRIAAERLEKEWQLLDARKQAGEPLPLFGVPFAIKDNIDAEGWITTAACPEFAYQAEKDAGVIAELRKAGALLIGKTNLDQFATGLVGTRSPYGAVPNSFNPDYVSGGSSSGSASVVARGLVPFALGTDTAGSGRVPAGFNNLVGLKPTRGWLSTSGVVPACRTLDCVSVFALTVEDALQVARLAAGESPDPTDPWSRTHPQTTPVALPERPRLAIPSKLEFYGDTQMQVAFAQARSQLEEVADLVEIDFSAFADLAALLYQGPWVAERTHALGSLLGEHPEAIDPTVRQIVSQGGQFSALDYFAAEYRRQALSRRIHRQLAEVDALVVPTSPRIRTLAEMEKEPLVYNSQFGTYTNFTNLADLCALALPAGFREDGLPVGLTLIATAWQDTALAEFGQRWQAHLALSLGATGREFSSTQEVVRPPAPDAVRLAVVGAHLTGMPLNFQLTSRNARLVEATETAPEYQLYALANTTPPKPGLVKVGDAGASIKVELWDIPLAHFGAFVAEIPEPLGIGNLSLKDGRVVKGFICEPLALESATDITHLGGWRAYIAELNKQKEASA
ncbi:allophanate hydrolase [Marinospirillum sp.]|uniref:allophanate hydrolase n=1 Tax=Marinospirillum sp. TaxID=2183934 RepID=UPI0028701B1C|nr:allophanate hydrolase [Marinospirillum sp.]MDR9468906.1 allophanate hydrolase [Marinospirillum sp.]